VKKKRKRRRDCASKGKGAGGGKPETERGDNLWGREKTHPTVWNVPSLTKGGM